MQIPRRLELLFSFLLCSALLLGAAEAANLGGLVKGDLAVLGVNESHVFTALVWSADEARSVRLSVSHPEGWLVFVSPESVELGSGKGSEIVLAPERETAVTVKVFVRPESAKPGRYFVDLFATALLGDSGLKMSQSLRMRMTVDVPGEAAQPDEPSEAERTVEVAPLPEYSIEEVSGQPEKEDVGDAGYVLYILAALVGVLVISFAIYRYA